MHQVVPVPEPLSAEVLLAILASCARAGLVALGRPEFDPANLAADRLGKLGELQPANALVRCEVLATVSEDVARQFPARFGAPDKHDVSLRNSQPQWSPLRT